MNVFLSIGDMLRTIHGFVLEQQMGGVSRDAYRVLRCPSELRIVETEPFISQLAFAAFSASL